MGPGASREELFPTQRDRRVHTPGTGVDRNIRLALFRTAQLVYAESRYGTLPLGRRQRADAAQEGSGFKTGQLADETMEPLREGATKRIIAPSPNRGASRKAASNQLSKSLDSIGRFSWRFELAFVFPEPVVESWK